MSPNWCLRESDNSVPAPIPVTSVDIPKYTILQRKHTRSEEPVKGEKTEKTEKSESESRIAKNGEIPKIAVGISDEKLKREKHDLSIPVHSEMLTTCQWVGMKALIDSGCTNSLIDLEWLKSLGLELALGQKPIIMVNVDGSQNWEGIIKYGIDLVLVVGDHWERVHFLLGRSKSHKVILRHDWLKWHNPVIDWVEGKVEFKQCSAKCFPHPAGQTQWLWTKNPKVSALAAEAIPDTTFTNDGPTPDWASHYPSVFSEAKWDELLKSRPNFNIKIEFREDPKHLSSKLYLLTREETVEMNRWIDKQLARGR